MRNPSTHSRPGGWGIILIVAVGLLTLSHGSNFGVTSAATQAALPPIGNTYPAGPAPTSAPPSGGMTQVKLKVPGGLQTGVFAQDHRVNLPSGFAISLYAQLEGNVRLLAFSPDNMLFATEQGSGNVVRVVDTNGVGHGQVWASGFHVPHGLAFYTVNGQTYLYVSELNRVVRFKYTPGQTQAGDAEVVIPDLPGSNGHVTRTIVFGKDGNLYVSMGSGCNVCVEDDQRRAAVMQFNADGSGGKIFASGLRNGVGLALNPTTGEIWETENSRDNLGDDMPPDEINILQDGNNYGWPYCVSNKVWDTDFGQKDQAYCDSTIAPALPFQAHSAPLGIGFYTGKTFPQEYQGDAFVAFHGSWNRSQKTGYKVVRVRLENGRPSRYEDFLTGFLVDQNVWGRPVDPITGPDGSLYLSDDTANAIYKITYQGH